jgi:predicted FMN-binding regulatory protein PaiB
MGVGVIPGLQGEDGNVTPDVSGYLDAILPWPTYWNNEDNEMDRVPTCCVCLVNPRRIVWKSCRHAVLCMQCLNKLLEKTRKERAEPWPTPDEPTAHCPICRKEYTGFEIIRWTDTGKDWFTQKPNDEDHQHFFLNSKAFDVAADHQELRRAKYHDLIV